MIKKKKKKIGKKLYQGYFIFNRILIAFSFFHFYGTLVSLLKF